MSSSATPFQSPATLVRARLMTMTPPKATATPSQLLGDSRSPKTSTAATVVSTGMVETIIEATPAGMVTWAALIVQL